MYVNYQNPTINPHRQYVFVRSCDGETLLIAVNFSSDSCDLAINIPRHAFEMLNIPEGEQDIPGSPSIRFYNCIIRLLYILSEV